MKPITYWIQNEAINQLVEQYGSTLEKLTTDDRRTLISVLALPNLLNWVGWEPNKDAERILTSIEDLTRHEKDQLIEAIAATLTHQGNPWVENARKNVAIAQKESTPSHRDAH